MEIKVGREASNSIIVNDNAVSREHAVFKINEDSIVIEDLNSTNGTYVNGQKIKIARVTNIDKIQFGMNYQFDWKLLEPFIPNTNPKIIFSSQNLSQNKFTIGRDKSNNLVIDNIRVSRKHALVEKINGKWFIEDLDSMNGVFVNGKQMKKTSINFSDRISIAGISITLNEIINEKFKQDTKLSLSANSINFSINGKMIIDDVSFTIMQGEFVGLIGESGSGKTTLLTLLNGYLKPNEGNVNLNSIPLLENINEFKDIIGYVPQEDIIHKELEVEESLRYSAELRFDGKLSTIEIDNQVNKIINILNLEDTRKTTIGSSEKKGISGGQRKRVNLGQELISEPSILFLDEPTSGLDPRSDREVMNLLKSLTQKGKTVVLTTHNISSDNFKIFTHLLVMAKGGKLAYFGKSDEICNYFQVNEPFQIFDKLKEKDANYWQSKFRNSDIYKIYVNNRKKDLSIDKSQQSQIKNSKSRFSLNQFFTLLKRNFVIKIRDRVSTSILLLQAPIIAFLISIVFSRPDQSTEALFVLIIASIWLGCSNSAREIVSEQAIFKRERKVGLNINSYLLSKYTILSVLCLLQCLILTGITGQSLDFLNPIPLFLILFATSLSALSLGLFISSLSKTNDTAIALIPVILIPKVVLGGLISTFARMPDFVKALSGFMLSRWSFEAVLINQFSSGQQVSMIGFDSTNSIIDIIVILFFGILFLAATRFILIRKDNVK